MLFKSLHFYCGREQSCVVGVKWGAEESFFLLSFFGDDAQIKVDSLTADVVMLQTFVSNPCRIIVCLYCTVTALPCKWCAALTFFFLPLLPLDHNNVQREVSINEDGSEEGKSCLSTSRWPWSDSVSQSRSVADHYVNKSLNCPSDPSVIAQTLSHCSNSQSGTSIKWDKGKKNQCESIQMFQPCAIALLKSSHCSAVYNGRTCFEPHLKPGRGDSRVWRSTLAMPQHLHRMWCLPGIQDVFSVSCAAERNYQAESLVRMREKNVILIYKSYSGTWKSLSEAHWSM